MCSTNFFSSENDLLGLQEGHWNILRFLGSGAEGRRSSSLASRTSAMTSSFVKMVASGLAVVVLALKTTSTSDGNQIPHNSSVRGERTSSPLTLAPVRGLVSWRCSPRSSTTCLKAKSVRVSLSPLTKALRISMIANIGSRSKFTTVPITKRGKQVKFLRKSIQAFQF